MNAVLFSVAAFFSTLGGGLFALRFSDRLHFLLSFTAGVLLGVVSFDILPEIFRLTAAHTLDPSAAMIALVAGFLFFHAVEKFVLMHPAHEEDYATHRHPEVGVASALALSGHSFMDGVGIGLAFQISPAVGIAVAIAVIAHDFCDGLNTVGLMLAHDNTKKRASVLLLLDAAAPLVGAASTLAFRVPPALMTQYLGFFAGFLLYIAAADILPEAHSRGTPGSSMRLIALTCLGAAVMYGVARLAG
jgi:ZIP family zinc transporter